MALCASHIKLKGVHTLENNSQNVERSVMGRAILKHDCDVYSQGSRIGRVNFG